MWYNLNLKKKNKKKQQHIFLCVGKWGGGGGGAATALMAQGRQRGHNELGPTEKQLCVCLFFVLMLHIKFLAQAVLNNF